jgi:16S rRNA (adenine1518-N6/adenine1519-N6)-dimethyltransferase
MRYHPSELQAFLLELGLSPKKSLSQNFLIDGNIIRKILHLADIKKGDHVLEIGPGPGALTEALLHAQAYVTAVEMDPNFAKALHKLQTDGLHLDVIAQDFLKFDIDSLCKKSKKKIKVVANLPYHITTPILARLLPLHTHIESLTVMVQKEVGLRFLAHPGTKDWNSFSLFLRFYADPDYGFTVEPSCFFPKPKVHSAVIKIILKKPPDISSPSRFFTVTRTAFQQRRKMLRASLKKLYSSEQIEGSLQELGKKPTTRPEDLSLHDFLRLFEIIEKKSQNIE